MSGIVTPEAVRLQFPDAGVGSRGVAFLIDACLVVATLLVVSLGTGAVLNLASVSTGVAVSVLLVLNFVILFGYPIVCEVAFGGRSLGKMALGLRVVTTEGAPVGFRHAAIRSAFMLVDFLLTLGAGAVFSALLTRRSQRLGDLVAGTVVLRERHATGPVRAARFEVPPGLEAYAATINPDVLDASSYEHIRAFLLRLPELTEDARRRIAEALAGPLLPSTPPPPPGTDAVTYLRVLVAVYQRGHAGPGRPDPASPFQGAADQRDAAPAQRPAGGFSAPD